MCCDCCGVFEGFVLGCCKGEGWGGCYGLECLSKTIEVKSDPTSPSRSPSTDGSQNGLHVFPLFWAPSRPLWIRQTDTQGRGSPFCHACRLINNACFPASSLSF